MKKLLFCAKAFMLLSCTLIFSCSPSNHTFGNSEKWMPENFEPVTTILLIEKFEENENQAKKMEDFMSQKYSYQYEFVSLATIKSREGKYADTKLYRYALVSSDKSEKWIRGDGSDNGMKIGATDFNFYDRSLRKNYPATDKPSSWASMTFKAIINTIEKKFPKKN